MKYIIQCIFTLVGPHSIYSPRNHSLHSTEYLHSWTLSLLSCFKICTSWNKIYSLYHTLFNVIHLNCTIHCIFTLVGPHSIYSPKNHSLHSTEYLHSWTLSLLSCFKICTSWNKIYSLYHTLFNSIQLKYIIQCIFTLVGPHSIYSPRNHSLHSTEYLHSWTLSLLSCFKICTSWNKIYSLYHTLFNIIHLNYIIHCIFTLVGPHSIYSPRNHSLHSTE